MKEHACFRVSVAEVAEDFAKYANLARTRTFEIWDDGKVDVVLVRISAIPEFHRTLQIAIPTSLFSDEEREHLMKPLIDEIG